MILSGSVAHPHSHQVEHVREAKKSIRMNLFNHSLPGLQVGSFGEDADVRMNHSMNHHHPHVLFPKHKKEVDSG